MAGRARTLFRAATTSGVRGGEGTRRPIKPGCRAAACGVPGRKPGAVGASTGPATEPFLGVELNHRRRRRPPLGAATNWSAGDLAREHTAAGSLPLHGGLWRGRLRFSKSALTNFSAYTAQRSRPTVHTGSLENSITSPVVVARKRWSSAPGKLPKFPG